MPRSKSTIPSAKTQPVRQAALASGQDQTAPPTEGSQFYDKIEYFSGIDFSSPHAGYAVGTKNIRHSSKKHGEFEIRVTGNREAVIAYGEQAVITQMKYVPPKKSAQRKPKTRAQVAGKTSTQADADAMGALAALAPLSKMSETELDWSKDRLIEIKPLGVGKRVPGALFSFAIDPPTVKKGMRDVYEILAYDLDENGRIDVWIKPRGGKPVLTKPSSTRAIVTAGSDDPASYDIFGDEKPLGIESDI